MASVRFLFSFALLSATAFSQTFRGDLAGSVTDATGGALSDSVIKVESPSTGLNRSLTTNATGDFLVNDLPVGTYDLTVTMTRFEVRKITGIEIAVAKTTNVPVQLGVAKQLTSARTSKTISRPLHARS